MVEWVLKYSPRDFGFLRSRWCCGVIVLVVVETYELRVSRETVRRWLRQEQIVWRRPRPVVGPCDPQRKEKLQALRQLLASLPANEIAVFQDEVDINTNPKIGAMWMRRGYQAKVVPPGTNAKRYLSGSLNWRTGTLLLLSGVGFLSSQKQLMSSSQCVTLNSLRPRLWDEAATREPTLIEQCHEDGDPALAKDTD